MLCQLQQETGHREGFNLSLEEVVIRGVGDDDGLAILLDSLQTRSVMSAQRCKLATVGKTEKAIEGLFFWGV